MTGGGKYQSSSLTQKHGNSNSLVVQFVSTGDNIVNVQLVRLGLEYTKNALQLSILGSQQFYCSICFSLEKKNKHLCHVCTSGEEM